MYGMISRGGFPGGIVAAEGEGEGAVEDGVENGNLSEFIILGGTSSCCRN